MGMVIKGLLALFWLGLVPWCIGGDMAKGYAIIFFLMEVLTLPLIFARAPLHVLVWLMGGLLLILAVAGLHKRRESLSEIPGKLRSLLKKRSLLLFITVGLILFQMAFMCIMTHLDADDSFYVGEAVTDAATDTIFQYSPYTGFPYESLPKRYTLSPMPVFTAVISKLCLGLHPAVLAHMLLPPFFLLIVVSVERRYAKLFFPGKKDFVGGTTTGKRINTGLEASRDMENGLQEEERYQTWFILFCHVILQFSSWSIYNSGNFTMIRLWQGKALLTAAFLPLVIYEGICILKEERKSKGVIIGAWPFPWLLIYIISSAFLSSMGILLGGVVVGVFFLLSLIQRDFKKAQGFLACAIPDVLLAALYLIIW